MIHYLVTGASGFVGSHLVCELLQNPSALVCALVRKDSNLWRLPLGRNRLHIIKTDFQSLETTLKVIKSYVPTVCFHLAWEGVQRSFRDNYLQKNNLDVTSFTLELSKKVGIKKFIGLGSQAEYGVVNGTVKESMVLNPITLYGKEKVKASQFCKRFCEENGMVFNWLRLFSSYGPNDNPDWLIPYVIRSLHKNKSPKLTHGNQRWDYLYINDVVKALIAVSQSQKEGTYNLGSGRAQTIRSIVCLIHNLMNSRVELEFGELERALDIQHLEADMSLFFRDFLFRPGIGMKKGLKTTIHEFNNSFQLLT